MDDRDLFETFATKRELADAEARFQAQLDNNLLTNVQRGEALPRWEDISALKARLNGVDVKAMRAEVTEVQKTLAAVNLAEMAQDIKIIKANRFQAPGWWTPWISPIFTGITVAGLVLYFHLHP